MVPADVAAANRARTPHAHTSHAIQHLHAAVAHEPDPKHKAALAQALQQLTRLQAEIMAPPKPGQSGGQ